MWEYDNNIEELQNEIAKQIDFEKLNDFCEHLTEAIQEIFDSCGLYFRIFSRVKSIDSIAEKLHRRKYGTVNNPNLMQDLVGLRIVLYYSDDLSICRDIMESTFQMSGDWSLSNQKANEFKATKINGVFRFPAEYFNLYKKELWNLPIDTTFEIQFRTVFFEGWHEIEHDMRYKSLLTDEEFWAGNVELSRILNCILANLELSDWSLVQLFDELSYNHYKIKNWEMMLKSKFRIRVDESIPLDPSLVQILNNNPEISKTIFKCGRQSLIRELLKLDHPNLNYNLIIQLLNERMIHNSEIASICKSLPQPKDEKAYQKTIFTRLESSVLFHEELPLLHKESRTLESEFNNAAFILYKWARFKFNTVFDEIPEMLSSYQNRLPGYQIKLDYQPDKMIFSMKIHYIDSKSVGTLWHVHSYIMPLEDGRLHFYHMTSRDMPHGIAQRNTFVKPSFLSDLSSKVGLEDVVRLSTKAHFVTTEEDFDTLRDLENNINRTLPLVVILQQHNDDNILSENDYWNGYDMNTFTINGMRLAKVTGLYSHIYMLNKDWVGRFAMYHDMSVSRAEGAICIFWPPSQNRTRELYTQEMICDAAFDFNRFAFHDQNISEKAFRHRLVQMIKDDNVIH